MSQSRRYSVFAIAREAFREHRGWSRAWASPEPRQRYKVVIVGAGGHGLATAYYLGRNFGITDIAIIEKGWLGGGNTGRNTTIIRSNYLQDPSAAIYDKSLKLYETLSQDLNYNVMFSPRGVINLAHNDAQVDAFQRRGN
ncbi:MAG: FAD-dependent oxidoreductase, partial [Paracoccus sp. (in: a-proteobacteria)]